MLIINQFNHKFVFNLNSKRDFNFKFESKRESSFYPISIQFNNNLIHFKINLNQKEIPFSISTFNSISFYSVFYSNAILNSITNSYSIQFIFNHKLVFHFSVTN